jgi:hypothetical protein
MILITIFNESVQSSDLKQQNKVKLIENLSDIIHLIVFLNQGNTTLFTIDEESSLFPWRMAIHRSDVIVTLFHVTWSEGIP